MMRYNKIDFENLVQKEYITRITQCLVDQNCQQVIVIEVNDTFILLCQNQKKLAKWKNNGTGDAMLKFRKTLLKIERGQNVGQTKSKLKAAIK